MAPKSKTKKTSYVLSNDASNLTHWNKEIRLIEYSKSIYGLRSLAYLGNGDDDDDDDGSDGGDGGGGSKSPLSYQLRKRRF